MGIREWINGDFSLFLLKFAFSSLYKCQLESHIIKKIRDKQILDSICPHLESWSLGTDSWLPSCSVHACQFNAHCCSLSLVLFGFHRWKEAIAVAENQKHPDVKTLKRSHFEWLLETGQASLLSQIFFLKLL